MALFAIRDYPYSIFQKFIRLKDYLKLKNEIRTVAVYKTGGGLGDLVQSIPLFRSFRQMFPQAKIAYLGLYQRPRCDRLFKNIPYIDEYIEYVRPGRQRSFAEYFRFLKKYFNKFDLIVDTQAKFAPTFYIWLLNPTYFLSRNPLFSNWKFILSSKNKVHIAAKMLFLARALGLEEINFSPAIDIPRDYLSLAQDYLKRFAGPFITILPGAGHPYKMWAKERFAALADMFCSMGYQVIFAGAASEKDLLLMVSRMMKNRPIIPLADEPKFGQDPVYSAGLFRSSALTVGNDCGGLHLATLAGCPVIGIYGPTNPVKSGPLGNRNAVVYKGWGCSPCRLKDCRIHRGCLEEITPKEVFEVASFILRDTSPIGARNVPNNEEVERAEQGSGNGGGNYQKRTGEY